MVNYIYKRVLITDDKRERKLNNAEFNDIIKQNNIVQIAPDAYINLDNVSQIDFVNSIIIFENGEEFNCFSKKIYI